MLSVVRRNPQLHYIDSFLRCSQNKFLVLTKQTYTTTSRICEKTRLVPKVKLPRQPVPDLQHTLSKYLRTVQPLLSLDEYKVTETLVHEFKKDGGIGQKLQDYLVERAKNHENWLSEWWLNCAYLEFRKPVVVWSSPGLVYPLKTFNRTADQLTYAANLIKAALSFKEVIDQNRIPPEMIGSDPLDMSQYKKIFGTCRVPRPIRDELIYNCNSNHIIVIHNNNFFRLNVLSDDNNILNTEDIYDNLVAIVENSLEKTLPIGILTSENRDTWAECYHILEKDPKNQETLREIQTSLFVLSLDTVCDVSKVNYQTKAALQTVHGGGSKCNSGNRWFDKTVEFVINQGGEVGLTYEHSPAEGQPIAVMTDHIVEYLENKFESVDVTTTRNYSPKNAKLSFVITEQLKNSVHNAEKNIDKLVNNLEMNCFTYKNYGKSFIKSQKLSPDSYIQMAQQYAFYRLHNVPGAHYESASTRRFLHGRTETIRSCSIESIRFAQTMLSTSAGKNEKISALINAIESHKQYAVEAMQGLGVDRHLLGLKMAAKELGIEVPELFLDKGYIRTSHMRISSSQVAAKCDAFMCYGPLVEDGYACCYNPRKEDIIFAISAFRSCKETNSSVFKETLEYSLDDMKNLFLSA